MSRAIIKFIGGGDYDHCNLIADSMEWTDEYLFLYSGKKLVGVFDVGVIQLAYLSIKSEG